MTGFPQWSSYMPSFPPPPQQWQQQTGQRIPEGFPQPNGYCQFMERARSFEYPFPPPPQSFYQPAPSSQFSPPISDSQFSELEQNYGMTFGQPYFQESSEDRETGSPYADSDQQFTAPEVLKPGPSRSPEPEDDSSDTLQVFDIREIEKYVDGEQWIDTNLLAKAIYYELTTRSIPQTSFASNVINRSQGTLSDLIRNPKPWEEMKSGRETFRSMLNWLKMSPSERRRTAEKGMPESFLSKAQKRKFVRKVKIEDEEPAKKKRLVFTELQKRTLQKIFNESQNPSKQMMEIVGERLGLTFRTVQNYFMNARRKAKMERDNED